MSTDQRALLDTLIERWEEVAEAYKAKGDDPDDDLTRRYSDYRHIYVRNIRDLRHVLDTGQIPCSLMSDQERRRGDCGVVHDNEDDEGGQPASDAAEDPWAAIHPAEYRVGAMERVIVGHLDEEHPF